MLLIVTSNGDLIMHLRDDRAGVLHRGCWAGFGGAVETGESFDEALKREILEETGIVLNEANYLGAVTDEISEGGKGDVVQMYFSKGAIVPEQIQLTEGAGIGVFSIDELKKMNVSPFVKRIILDHPELFSSE